jgi:predicted nuclease of restriction endonuclease-like (RecB) superfamily
MTTNLPADYLKVLADLKAKIKEAKSRAAVLVNVELLRVYWEIGKAIIEQQKAEGWGTKVIDRLAKDLKSEFNDMQGLSVRNLKYMRTFAEAYPDFTKVQPPVAQIQESDKQSVTIVQQLVAQIPWSHNIILLDRLETPEDRLFYAQKTIENNWSKNVLALQIESGLIKRQGKAITNFKSSLPAPDSDLAQEMLKNPYVFDFLTVSQQMKEREVENALIAHLKEFILELGRGFAYVGNQFNLNVAGDDFYLDLLFYNTRLHCYVVFELKVGEFKPEYAGKLNFYLNAIDIQIKGDLDKPTIGVLLCKTPNETVVEYALRGIDKPVGVADYELKAALPSAKELEEEIEKEVESIEQPLKAGLDKIKRLISTLKGEKVEIRLSPAITLKLFNDVLVTIYSQLKTILKDSLDELFESTEILIRAGIANYEFEQVRKVLEQQSGQIQDMAVKVTLKGFKAAGLETFNIENILVVDLDEYKYTCRFQQQNNFRYVRLYHQPLTNDECKTVALEFCKTLTEETAKKLEQIEQ